MPCISWVIFTHLVSLKMGIRNIYLGIAWTHCTQVLLPLTLVHIVDLMHHILSSVKNCKFEYFSGCWWLRLYREIFFLHLLLANQETWMMMLQIKSELLSPNSASGLVWPFQNWTYCVMLILWRNFLSINHLCLLSLHSGSMSPWCRGKVLSPQPFWKFTRWDNSLTHKWSSFIFL